MSAARRTSRKTTKAKPKVVPRYPAGTWMQLKSGGVLREMMNTQNKSLADVARYAGVSRGFISHLTSGRDKTCSPRVGQRIADLLASGAVSALFEVHVPPAGGQSDNRHAGRPAA